MTISLKEAKEKIRSKGLRATTARISVLQLFVEYDKPLSHGKIVSILKDKVGDQATLYRILVKFKDTGILRIASTANGINRYELNNSSQNQTHHKHPHFVCNDCGEIACLPLTSVVLEKDNPWYPSLTHAEMQFIGTCMLCQ